MSSEFNRLEDNQLKFCEWLFRHNDGSAHSGDPASQAEYAKAENIPNSTLSGWRKGEAFQAAYRDMAVAALTSAESQHQMFKTIDQAIKDNDRQAYKDKLALMEKYRPIRPLEQQVASLEDLTDQELIDLLVKAASLKGLQVEVKTGE